MYTYDNIMSLRAKRGNLQVAEVDYPSGFEYLATDTEFNYDAAGNRTSVIDGSGTCTYTINTLNQYTAAGTTSYQYDNSGNMVHDATYAYGYDPENRLVKVRQSGPYGTLTLGEALDSPLTYTTGGDGNWTAEWGEGYNDMNAAYGPSLAQGQESWLQTTVEGAGTISFWAKISPADAGNELKFYVGDTLRYSYSCESEEWEQFSWEVTGTGTHTFKWVSERGSATYSSTGYVDDVGWTGALPAVPPPEPAVTNWRYLTYTYDASGRRIEKKYDDETITKYVYDGDHCIAEYDGSDQLLRQYIYGPGVDEPICMIEKTGSYTGTYYYHFDGLGSVVALTDSNRNTVQTYDYDVYGQVSALDASHPNRFMFTGREHDKETGLYYYRARYYNPQIGRFLQTDPVGYGAGMNLYRYCMNNPLMFVDPWGNRAWWANALDRIGSVAGGIADAVGRSADRIAAVAGGAAQIAVGVGIIAGVAATAATVPPAGAAVAGAGVVAGTFMIATGVMNIIGGITGEKDLMEMPNNAVSLTTWALGTDGGTQVTVDVVMDVVGGKITDPLVAKQLAGLWKDFEDLEFLLKIEDILKYLQTWLEGQGYYDRDYVGPEPSDSNRVDPNLSSSSGSGSGGAGSGSGRGGTGSGTVIVRSRVVWDISFLRGKDCSQSADSDSCLNQANSRWRIGCAVAIAA